MDSTVVYLTDKIAIGIQTLADALKVPASQVWEITIRQMVIEGYRSLLGAGIGLSLMVVGGIVARKAFKRFSAQDSDGLLIVGILAIFAVIGGGLGFFTNLWDAFILLNLEYHAIQRISTFFR